MKLSLACFAAAILVTESAQAGDILDFPIPDSPIVIPAQSESGGASIADLIALYSEATGQHCVMDSATQGYANSTPVSSQAGGSMSIAPERVQVTFETLLVANDFVLTPLTADEPRLFSITSLNTARRNTVSSLGIFLPADRVDDAAAHPAILFTTAIDLPGIDVRNLASSIRHMFPDQNISQLLAVGSTSSVAMWGFGPMVKRTRDLLMTVKATNDAKNKVLRSQREVDEPKRRAQSPNALQVRANGGSQAVRIAGA
jgi:hypothetical protein